jgi:hypothetical protein
VSADGAWPWAAALTIHDAHDDPRFCGGEHARDIFYLFVVYFLLQHSFN